MASLADADNPKRFNDTLWNPVCSAPTPLPSHLTAIVTPNGPVVAAINTEVVLTCGLESNGNTSWLNNVHFSWELDGSPVPSQQYHSLTSNMSILAFNMSTLHKGLYRCIVNYSDADYPLTNVGTAVQVELASEYRALIIA
jgi:hypothetical protein